MTDTDKPHTVPLGELASIVPGYSPRAAERARIGKYLLIGGRNIQEGRLVTTDKDSYIDEIPKQSFVRAIAKLGDIIVSTLFDRRKLYIYQKKDAPGVVNNSCAIIRAPGKSDYIISYLRTLAGQEQFLRDATRATAGTFIPRLSISAIGNIRIPILPLRANFSASGTNTFVPRQQVSSLIFVRTCKARIHF